MSPRGPYVLLLVAFALLPVSSAVSAALLLAAGAWHARSRSADDREPLPRWAWAALLVAVAASVAHSVNPGLSWPSLPLAGGYFVVVWTVGGVLNRRERLWRVCQVLCASGAAAAALGILQALLAWHVTVVSPLFQLTIGTQDNRADSVLGHPNILSGYLLLLTGLGLALALCHPGRGARRAEGTPADRAPRRGPATRTWAACGLGLMLVCQILTYSRSGWIGTAVALALVGALLSRRLLAVGAAGVAVGGAVFAPKVIPRVLTLFAPDYLSNSNRVRVWRSAVQMIGQRPWLGFGPGTWPQVYPFFRDPGESEHLPHAHNLFLMVGAEYGLVGLAALLIAIVATAISALRGIRRERPGAASDWERFATCLVGVLAGYLTVGLFEFTFSEGRNSILFFTLLGLLVAARSIATRERAAALAGLDGAAAPETPLVSGLADRAGRP